jgi:urea carboxylase
VIEVLAGGAMTTVQDHPGRLGYWAVGIPPSGPMDDLSFRLANRAVGNGPGAAGLELSMLGPTLRFDVAATICLTGAAMRTTMDGGTVPWWTPIDVRPGSTLRVGGVVGPGARAYLAVRGGIDGDEYLGSRSTFTLGGFGGLEGRALAAGDVLQVAADDVAGAVVTAIPPAVRPDLTTSWRIGVLDGPHGAPDFFTDGDIETLFDTGWEVHHNSARTGVRLIGPKPTWARPDGGEAGLHPSNIHDNAYGIGTIDFTGDMPVLLGPDGPSLGGFVCPATVVAAERWKLGQLKAGDVVQFVPVTPTWAAAADEAQRRSIDRLRHATVARIRRTGPPRTVLEHRPAGVDRPSVTVRRSGDRYVLVELGEQVLDIELRVRVHALHAAVEAAGWEGIVDVTPGIRSLQVHVDGRAMTVERLIPRLLDLEASLPPSDDTPIASRVVHLPLSWDDPSTQEAIRRYMSSVRDDAPWCPSNLEFIRRMNGLDSIEDVRRVVFDASYVVLGLGDVYLGAPVATPLDPRHRLVTTKYNPARTWTPENAVGIGGAYLCVYGMEGPGGYQFVGRTVPMWNRFRSTEQFEPGRPWLLRFFDQLRFFPVEADELLDWREGVITGRRTLPIEETTFQLAEHRRFLVEHAASIAAFQARQQAAFAEERVRWAASGELTAVAGG